MKITPLDLRVLIRLDPTEKKIGNIIIPDSASERNQMAEVRGTVEAMGENAFCEIKGGKPQPGDKVMIAKYAGVQLAKERDDDPNYRIVNDEDVIAVLEE